MDVVNRAFVAMMTVLPWELVFIVRPMRNLHKYVCALGIIDYMDMCKHHVPFIRRNIREYFQCVYTRHLAFRNYIQRMLHMTEDVLPEPMVSYGESKRVWDVNCNTPKFMRFVSNTRYLERCVCRLDMRFGHQILYNDMEQVD